MTILMCYSSIIVLILKLCDVINGQSMPNVTVQDATVTLGEDATINCFYTIYGGRTLLAVTWYGSNSVGAAQGDLLVSSSVGTNPNGKYSVDDSQAGVATLNIANTLLSDDGFYQCAVVDSGTLSGNHFGSLTVHFINGQTIPNVAVQDASVTLEEDATINCFYTIYGGRTLLGVNWYSSNSAGAQRDLLVSSSIGSNPNDRHSVDISQAGVATLNIANTLLSDDGFYQCTIVDSGGLNGNHFGSLTVHYLYDVMIDINSNTTAENVTITCSANGSPSPMINLNKDDVDIKTENDSFLTYKIDNVTKSDGGSYKCKATNNVGNKYSGTIVLNYFKPEVTLDKEVVTIAPGGSNTITAKVSANPNDITYKWTIDPENYATIIPHDDVTDPFSSTITIMASESTKDSTEYTVRVEVTNNIGSTTQQAKGIDYCVSSPCENEGTCIPANFEFTCECKQGYSGRYCESDVSTSSNCTSLTIGIFFVGMIVGAFGVIGGLISYTKIKQVG
ncbi:neural cell adhesion molecule 2-like [Anneissia japonica]|uniref:neural cell adhesion molecule 2-like n=1 Tax=Anneissia japonica TaxID=1529436 RepID=UPI0014257EC8|nr:neural cell adhesion molecule 2-like [Anneissia japonica]